MADWDLLELSVVVGGDTEEVTKMRERLSAIMENRNKLNDADWLRSLFGKELSENANIEDNVDDDEYVTDAFLGFRYNWNEITDHETPKPLFFTSVDEQSTQGAVDFVQALWGCFPRVRMSCITTGYNSSNDEYVAFDNDFVVQGGINSWSGNTGKIVLDAYKEWREAESENDLAPVGISKEDKEKLEQKEEDTKIAFLAVEYAYSFLGSECDGVLPIDKNNIELEGTYIGYGREIAVTVSSETYISLVYKHYYHEGLLQIIDFSNCEDQPTLPKNVAEAVKKGKIKLEGYKKMP